MTDVDVAIIGAGASGVLVAGHLSRTAPSLSAAVLDAGARAARGLAYGTPYGAHLLNVPAGRMSAFEDDSEHFTRWLTDRNAGASGKVFAPRSLYGEYLAGVLAQTCTPPSRVTRISGTAVGLTHDLETGAWRIHLHDGRTLVARSVVLALGNLPPADPLTFKHGAPENYLSDPWAPGAAQGLAAQSVILLIGTGLTMIDLVLALRAEGHRGVVHAISRRGHLPRAHAPHLPRPVEAPDALSPRLTLRWIRDEITTAARQGHDWRSVIDALRPYTHELWRSWTTPQRRSFLRHARVLWDVHRHRSAPEVADQIEALIGEGALVIHSGRVEGIRDEPPEVEVTWIERNHGRRQVLRVARVINCTGPASDYAAIDLPLVAQLRRAGWLVPDTLRLGIETDAQGRLVGSDGAIVPGLFTIGPLRRSSLWESTAIPEIREQASALASLLASDASRRQTGTTKTSA